MYTRLLIGHAAYCLHITCWSVANLSACSSMPCYSALSRNPLEHESSGYCRLTAVMSAEIHKMLVDHSGSIDIGQIASGATCCSSS